MVTTTASTALAAALPDLHRSRRAVLGDAPAASAVALLAAVAPLDRPRASALLHHAVLSTAPTGTDPAGSSRA